MRQVSRPRLRQVESQSICRKCSLAAEVRRRSMPRKHRIDLHAANAMRIPQLAALHDAAWVKPCCDFDECYTNTDALPTPPGTLRGITSALRMGDEAPRPPGCLALPPPAPSIILVVAGPFRSLPY